MPWEFDEFVPGKPDEAAHITDEQQRLAALTGTALLELRVQERAPESVKARLVQSRTAHWLVNILQTDLLPRLERAETGKILAHMGDPRFNPDIWFLPDEEPMYGFIHIPAGRFMMGSNKKKDPRADDREGLQHKVELSEYYIARYPVTVAQFKAFAKVNEYGAADPKSLSGFPNYPVVNVTWHDAVAYCDWLTERLSKLPNLLPDLRRGWRVTLPSEAEWERAARGTEGRIYPWGDEFDPDKANTFESGINGTSAVGCFLSGASPEGLLDASGNVWEWTRSHFEAYPYPPIGKEREKREPLAVGSDVSRVLRGGSWHYDQRLARCAFRRWYNPDSRDNYVGFRVSLCAAP